MSQDIQIPLTVKVDDAGDEFYVGRPRQSTMVDLATTTFVVLHPERDGDSATMIVKPRRPRRAPSKATDRTWLSEVRRAEQHFDSVPGGYVGYGYFINNWKSQDLPVGLHKRKPVVDRLVEEGRLEVYAAPDGKEAIRSVA